MKRISQIMSERGLCSRREAEFLIDKKWLSVNGELLEKQGLKFEENCDIEIHQKAQSFLDEQKTFLINKPKGYVSSQPEGGLLPAVSLLKRKNQDKRDQNHFKAFHLKGLAPAGRLDYESTGLLVLSQKGSLVKKLIGQDSGMEKEYVVKVEGKITEEKIQKLTYGLELDEKKLKKAKIKLIKSQTLGFILQEGRKRQIRRMCQLLDLEVISLNRIRIGKIKLNDLKEGCWRYLKPGEEF